MSILGAICMVIFAICCLGIATLCLVGAIVPRFGGGPSDAEVFGMFAFAAGFAVIGIGMLFFAGFIL